MSQTIVLGRERPPIREARKRVDFEVEKLKEKTLVNTTKEGLRTLRRVISLIVENDKIINITLVHPTNVKKTITKHISDLTSVRHSDVKPMKVKLFWGEQEMPDRYLFLQQNDLDLFNNLISKSNIKQQNEETRYSSPQKQAMNANNKANVVTRKLQSVSMLNRSDTVVHRPQPESNWQTALKSRSGTQLQESNLRKPSEYKLVIRLLEHIIIPGVTNIVEHDTIVEVSIQSNASVHDLIRIAKSRIFNTPDYKDNLYLFRPPSTTRGGVWLESNRLLYVYSLEEKGTILELRYRYRGGNPERVQLKLIMPEIHTSKIIQFIKTSPIKCCIEDFLKRLHKSDVDLDAKFYRLFLVGHSQPLDNEKTIGFYGLNNMDTVILRKALIYEFAQNGRSDNLILEAEMKVSDCVRIIGSWVRPPIMGNFQDFGIFSESTHIWLDEDSTLISYELSAPSILYFEMKKKRRSQMSEVIHDTAVRKVLITSSPPVATKILSHLDDLDYEISNNGKNILLHTADGHKEPLLQKEVVEAKFSVEYLRPRGKTHIRILGTLILTNYRVFWVGEESTFIPLGNIEKIGSIAKETIEIECKDATRYMFICNANYKLMKTHITELLSTPYFALSYREYFPSKINEIHDGWNLFSMTKELERQGVKNNRKWRISAANKNYELSSSYPSKLCVPALIVDSELQASSEFRTKGRIPALTYMHKNLHVICRASQPKVGLKIRRCPEDELLVDAIKRSSPNQKRLTVFDARPKFNAIANQAKGAGYEDINKSYSDCDIKFLNIDNIHAVRNSFKALKELCLNGIWEDGDQSIKNIVNLPKKKDVQSDWFSGVSNSHWFEHIETILSGTNKIVKSIIKHDTSVLIHCSDGWDRTSQLASLAQLIIDPFYRTIIGFEILLEKDWLSFGHKFAQRFGMLDKANKEEQKSPIFFQFLDCVFQIMEQYPCSFEFNERFLLEIAFHTTSLRFGTFLFNSEYERAEKRVSKRTTSLWSYLNHHADSFTNTYFNPDNDNPVLYINSSMRFLSLWYSFFYRDQDEHRVFMKQEELMENITKKYRDQNVLLQTKVDTLSAEIELLKAQLAKQST